MNIPRTTAFKLLAGVSAATMLWLVPEATAQLKSKSNTNTSQKPVIQKTIPAASDSKTATPMGDGTLRLSNGVTVPEQGPDGKPAARMGNGWIRYGDGTLLVPEVDGGVVMKRKGKTLGRLQDSSSFDQADIWKPAASSASGSQSGSSSSAPPSSGQSTQAKPQIYEPNDGTHRASPSQSRSTASTTPAKSTAPRSVATKGPAGTSSTTNTPLTDGGVERSIHSSGEATYTLSNGQQVPQSRNGVTGRPDGKGGVSYSDGTHVTVNDAGNTVVTRPDGSQSERTPSGNVVRGLYVEPRESTSTDGTSTYTLSNGQQVPRKFNGMAGAPDGKGGVVYTDGTHIFVDENGNTVTQHSTGGSTVRSPSGEVLSRDGITQARQSVSKAGMSTYTLSNGQKVPRTSDSGAVGTPDPKGGVNYDDGTFIYVNSKGNTVVRTADGQTRTYAPNGEHVRNEVIKPKETFSSTGEATYTLGNGQQVPRFGPDGRAGTVDAKGQIHYGDGTVIYVDANGQTQILNSKEAAYGSNGTEGVKDFSGAGESQGGTKGNASNPQSGSSGSTETSGSKDDQSDSSSQDDNSSTDNDNSSDSDDAESDSDSSDDTGDDGGSDDESTKNMGGGKSGSGSQPEAKTVVNTVVGRKTGESRTPDSTQPEPCGGASGGAPGSVSQPMAGSDQNCAPTTKYERNDNSAGRPVFTEPTRKPTGGVGSVINPKGLEDQVREQGPDSLGEKLEDIEGVTNPG